MTLTDSMLPWYAKWLRLPKMDLLLIFSPFEIRSEFTVVERLRRVIKRGLRIDNTGKHVEMQQASSYLLEGNSRPNKPLDQAVAVRENKRWPKHDSPRIRKPHKQVVRTFNAMLTMRG